MADICLATIKLFMLMTSQGSYTLHTVLEVWISDIDANCSLFNGNISFQFWQFPEQSYFPLVDLKREERFAQNC